MGRIMRFGEISRLARDAQEFGWAMKAALLADDDGWSARRSIRTAVGAKKVDQVMNVVCEMETFEENDVVERNNLLQCIYDRAMEAGEFGWAKEAVSKMKVSPRFTKQRIDQLRAAAKHFAANSPNEGW
jgi:hypothetical protein